LAQDQDGRVESREPGAVATLRGELAAFGRKERTRTPPRAGPSASEPLRREGSFRACRNGGHRWRGECNRRRDLEPSRRSSALHRVFCRGRAEETPTSAGWRRRGCARRGGHGRRWANWPIC